MPLSDSYHNLSPNEIRVERDVRQRKNVSTAGLRDSIQRYGVMNPIIVTREGVLVAGERRLQASRELNLPTIPVRYVDELSPGELQILELEENVKRSDLSWKEQVEAIGKLYEHYKAQEEGFSPTQMAELLCLSVRHFHIYYRVWRDLNNPKVATASTLAAAYHIIQRSDDRKTTEAVEKLFDVGKEAFRVPEVAPPPGLAPAPLKEPPKAAPLLPATALSTIPILNQSFLEWAPTYTGPTFNLIHCDFPYGVGVFDGAFGAGKTPELGTSTLHRQNPDLYDDSEKTYRELLTCLCTNLDRIASPSAHLIFWFSMKKYSETLSFFHQHAPSLVVNPTPLIWLKSDNKGVCPDPRRQPRHIYESAFFASREDRPLVRPASNAYAAPTDKSLHPSAKSEPMLRHFFQMFVDGTTTLLDPACGSGSALRAAESLGAKSVLGLEIDPDHWAAAVSATKQFRTLRKA